MFACCLYGLDLNRRFTITVGLCVELCVTATGHVAYAVLGAARHQYQDDVCGIATHVG